MPAFKGHTGTDDFRQTIVIKGFNFQSGFNFFSKILTPGLGTEQTDREVQFLGIPTHFFHKRGDMQGVTRCGYKGSCSIILHNQDLLHHIFTGVRDDRGSNFFHSIMKTEASGRQAVIKGYLN